MKNMQNEPNFKNNQINVTFFTAMNYGNLQHLDRRKNEPNTNPILSKGLSIDHFEQNMQNEPNLQKNEG